MLLLLKRMSSRAQQGIDQQHIHSNRVKTPTQKSTGIFKRMLMLSVLVLTSLKKGHWIHFGQTWLLQQSVWVAELVWTSWLKFTRIS